MSGNAEAFMLATLTPDQVDAGTRDAFAQLLANIETLVSEGRDVLANASTFRYSPEIWLNMAQQAEHRLATAITCAARSGDCGVRQT